MTTAQRTEAALKRCVDELQDRLEYALRERPRALQHARKRYIKFALLLYSAIERAMR
jgi:hypothetical protein